MKWAIGDVEIFQVVEMEGGELIQEFIPDATLENIKKIKWLVPHFADSDGHLKALVQGFLVKSNNKNILIDTCNGSGKNRPTCPTWGNLDSKFIVKLKSLGLNESDIDLVVCTHLHFDHIGWNTKKENDTWVPTFPNAKYLFVQKDYDYWKEKPEKEADDDKFAFDDSVEPIVKAKLVQFVDSNYQIDDNIKLVPTPGHTPGHVSVTIESNGKKALVSGDFIHHPCQLEHPEWLMEGADTLPEVTFETRKKVLNELSDTDTLLIGTHFSNPVAGKIIRTQIGFMLKTS